MTRFRFGPLALCASLLVIGVGVHDHGRADPHAAGPSIGAPIESATTPGPCLACRCSHERVASIAGPLVAGPPLPNPEPLLIRRASPTDTPACRRLSPRGPPARPLLDA